MKNIYLIGIGGIGMSALARYYKRSGYNVSGYDRTASHLTQHLEEEGIDIHYEDNINLIPNDIENTLVIYTPAVPHDLSEMVYVREHNYKLVKRSQALGEVARFKECLAISGTHGKTTTSTLLAHILIDSGEGCSAFLGGISKNYHSNLLVRLSPVLVAEADEFDRSFLQLYPDIAVITAMDADHLDIYSDVDHLREAFIEFASQVKSILIVKKGLESYFTHPKVRAKVFTYSFDNPSSDFYASQIVVSNEGYFRFTFNAHGTVLENCTLGIPGWVNVENAIAASAVAFMHGVALYKLKTALACFQGVERRFDVHINTPHCVYIDDYAHHPNEISAAISSIREMFPGRNLCGVFQPHLYTRTRDFYIDFAKSLSALDRLILLPIYPAREEPIPEITSEIILERVTIPNKRIIPKNALLEVINDTDIDILVTFGAGDIDRFVEPITQLLKEKMKC